MSLVGNLEDLSLGEILQIVSLSRKSGTLSLQSQGREASIVFRSGQVVRASSSMFPQNLGELLTTGSIIDPPTLRTALALQQSEGYIERLGAILVKHFDVNQDVIEEVVRTQVEKVVLSLFEWTGGNFDFKVQDLVDTVYDTEVDPLQFMLSQGLNPQLLVMEGELAMDEKREAINRGEIGGDIGDSADYSESDTQSATEPETSQADRPLVIVDDDGPTLQAVSDALRGLGYVVHAMERSEDTLIKIDSLIRAGEHPTILIDLIMPKMDGSGVLGGIELMDLLNNNFKNLPMIVMTDYPHAESEAKVCGQGRLFMLKPRRADIRKPQMLNDFIGRLQAKIQVLGRGEDGLAGT